MVTFGLYSFSYGLEALKPLPEVSTRVISPSIWQLIEITGHHLDPANPSATSTLIGALWPPLLLALAWYLYNRLSPDVPAVLAATCALTFAWVLVAPWSLPWYTAVAWVTLALLPRNSLSRWLAWRPAGSRCFISMPGIRTTTRVPRPHSDATGTAAVPGLGRLR